MIPKDIRDKNFGDGCVGWATDEDREFMLTLDMGTVFVPSDCKLWFVPVLRRTRLELIPVQNPKATWDAYEHSTPKANEERLAYIKKQRSVYYQDLGIHPLACIGEDGMGYEWEDGWVEFPQYGGVDIGKSVRIGAFTSIKKATKEGQNTVIGDGCKIGSHCNIGHNVQMGKNCLLTHRVSIAGSAVIGNNCFFGQGSIVMNKVKIGDNCIIGQGANVIANVPDNTKVIGLWK